MSWLLAGLNQTLLRRARFGFGFLKTYIRRVVCRTSAGEIREARGRRQFSAVGAGGGQAAGIRAAGTGRLPRGNYFVSGSTGEMAALMLLKLVCSRLMASRSGTASTLVLATTSLMVASPPAVRSVPR